MDINIHPNIFKVQLTIEDYAEFDRFMALLNFAQYSLDASRSVNEIAESIRSKLIPIYTEINQDDLPSVSSRSGID